LTDPSLRAVVLCPSNPLISIEPILAVPGIRAALAACRAPVIAVSPIIGGEAVKGPTTKMLRELGSAHDAVAVARRYRDFLDGYVIDTVDAAAADTLDIAAAVTATLMTTLQDREHLARVVIEFADQLAAARDVRSAAGLER
jgi:LPPG:FO 2-phospho-L-lactate transferase